jgi:aspartate/glutamate/glutamine transport system substrate-binding protein
MKKANSVLIVLISIILVLVIFTGCSKRKEKNLLSEIKGHGKIIVGVKFDCKPFGFIDSDQKLKGFDVDLSKEIAKRVLGNENAVEFKQVNSSNRILLLSSGAIDMVAATMTITDKRRQVVDFSPSYYLAGQAVMVPINSNIKSIKDLNNKKVVIVLGSTAEQNLKTLAPMAQIKGFRTYTDAFSALKAGRADAMTTDDTIITGLIMDNHNFKILKERYTVEPYGIAFRKSKETPEFQEAVNSALLQIKEDGTLKKIEKKWIDNV